ncbi:MAG: DUF4391 domain-containing protein [Lachnospiraceae bacterium]|nr:DUF4391 domain-containing protein [Lachnospiraceae bacterium]
MLEFPKTTEFNKRIPKQKFYENIQVTPALKRSFVEQIKVIYWKNKIAATTVNLAEEKDVTELEVFEIQLNGQELDEAVLRQIDREIPYHILFILKHEEMCKAIIGYKEVSASGNTAFKVNRYYQTDWMPEEELTLKLEGLSLDAVYENLVRQIAGDALTHGEAGESLRDSVKRNEEIQVLKKQIEKLQIKIRKEKQLNIQIQLNAELKLLKQKYNGLTRI